MLTYFANIFVTVLLLGSFLVWLSVVMRLRECQPPLAYFERTTHALDPTSVLMILLLWLAIPILIGRVLSVPTEASLLGVQVSCLSSGLWLFLVGVILVTNRRHGKMDFGIDLSDWKQQLIVAVLGFLASVVPVGLVQLLTIISGIRHPDQMHSYLSLLKEYPGATTFIWIGVAVVVVAPLAEEFMFRVILQGWLQTRLSAGQAIMIVALLFSGVHQWPDPLPLLPLALILGYIYYRRHSLLTVYVLHALFNLSNLAIALLKLPEDNSGISGAVKKILSLIDDAYFCL